MTLIETIRAALSGASANVVERDCGGLKATPGAENLGNHEWYAEADVGNNNSYKLIANLGSASNSQKPKASFDDSSDGVISELMGSDADGRVECWANETQNSRDSSAQQQTQEAEPRKPQKSGPDVHEQELITSAPVKRSANGRFVRAARVEMRSPRKDAVNPVTRDQRNSGAIGKSTGTSEAKPNAKPEAITTANGDGKSDAGADAIGDVDVRIDAAADAIGEGDTTIGAAAEAGDKPKAKARSPKIRTKISRTADAGSDAGRESGLISSDTMAGAASGGAEPSKAHDTRNVPKQNPAQRAGQSPSSGAITKSDQVLSRLRSQEGASIAELIDLTGWQAHSVRGFLSATVRKKLALGIMSETGADGIRRYRITDDGNETCVDSEVR